MGAADRLPGGGARDGAGLVALLGTPPTHATLRRRGAGIAIEDAAEAGSARWRSKGRCVHPAGALRAGALARGARCEARSRRNGGIFHATGLVRLGRNTSMRLLGERLLDQPWLYRPTA